MPKKNLFHSPAVQIGFRALVFFITFLLLLLAIIVMFGAFGILAAPPPSIMFPTHVGMNRMDR